MFKIYFKLFNDSEGFRHFELLEEAVVAFFRNLGPAVLKIELWENTGTETDESWRMIIKAIRGKQDEPFRLSREFNIF